MGVKYLIVIDSENLDHKVRSEHFVEQLQTRWPNAEIRYISDPRAHSVLQWALVMDDNSYMLGDFKERGISYEVSGLLNVANFALWYRSIMPFEYKLLLYKDSLNHRPIELVNGTTEEDIVNGFDVPFDYSPEN